jgi:hypothetical protein
MMPVATGLKPGANEIVSPPFKYLDAPAAYNKLKGGDDSPRCSFLLAGPRCRAAQKSGRRGSTALPEQQRGRDFF